MTVIWFWLLITLKTELIRAAYLTWIIFHLVNTDFKFCLIISFQIHVPLKIHRCFEKKKYMLYIICMHVTFSITSTDSVPVIEQSILVAIVACLYLTYTLVYTLYLTEQWKDTQIAKATLLKKRETAWGDTELCT